MPNAKPGQDEKLLGALSYLWILSIVILLVKRDSAFVQFHARQGLVLCIASIIFWWIPVLGWFLNLIILVLVIIGFVQALNGAEWKMPVVSELSSKIKL
jgi:uncharacterized membrane protein